MRTIIIKRLFSLVFVLIGISVIVFFAMHMVPGDPAEIIGGPTAAAEDIAAIRNRLGLNDPLLLQYWRYFRGLLKGDFGYSVQNRQPVLEAILIRLPNTVFLASCGIVVAVVIGIPLGIAAAVKHNTIIDHSSMAVALAGISIPNFWLGIVLILLFAVQLRWLPVGGLPEKLLSLEGLKHILMPALTLGTGSAALIARLTRSSMLEVIRKDYIRTARAKGLSQKKVVWVHAFRNALIPALTIVGLSFAVLLGGTIITEQVFAINGIGRLLVLAINSRDFPVVQGCVLLIAAMFVVINLIVDLLYTIVDPRISYSRG